jgi:hypothetical protein
MYSQHICLHRDDHSSYMCCVTGRVQLLFGGFVLELSFYSCMISQMSLHMLSVSVDTKNTKMTLCAYASLWISMGLHSSVRVSSVCHPYQYHAYTLLVVRSLNWTVCINLDVVCMYIGIVLDHGIQIHVEWQDCLISNKRQSADGSLRGLSQTRTSRSCYSRLMVIRTTRMVESIQNLQHRWNKPLQADDNDESSPSTLKLGS